MEHQSLGPTSVSLASAAPVRPDRRGGARHLTLFRVGALTVDGRCELCLITNISSGGMSIRPYCELAAGQSVVIELKSGMSVPGVVAWVEDRTAGIAFGAPVDVVDVLAPGDDRPRPRMPRVAIDCYATVRDGARVHRLKLCDVSQGGVKLAGDIVFDAGSDLSVMLPGLAAQPATLRWSDGGHVGLAFNRLLALSELVDWLSAIRDETRAA